MIAIIIAPCCRLPNCQRGMETAKQLFNIPLVLKPENLCSHELDELSGMTYLSYFMKVDSPGYQATLRWVREWIPQASVNNFQACVCVRACVRAYLRAFFRVIYRLANVLLNGFEQEQLEDGCRGGNLLEQLGHYFLVILHFLRQLSPFPR